MADASDSRNVLKYWNELSHAKHQFLTLMPQDYKHQMMIPLEFCECFKGKLGEWCTLKGPSGATWTVRVTQPHPDYAQKIISDGWANFVQDNGVKELDLLVFSSSDSAYNVSIFTATGCERESAYFSSNQPTPIMVHESESESELEPEAYKSVSEHKQHFSSSRIGENSSRSSRAWRRRVRKEGRLCD